MPGLSRGPGRLVAAEVDGHGVVGDWTLTTCLAWMRPRAIFCPTTMITPVSLARRPGLQEIKKIAMSKSAERDLPFSAWSLSKMAGFLVGDVPYL
jgi:hypothetical protein